MNANTALDQPDVVKLVDEARRELAAGKDKQAARLLTDAAYHTHDPQIEEEVRKLALEGRGRAGFLGKGRWDEIIRIADLHAAKRQSQG